MSKNSTDLGFTKLHRSCGWQKVYHERKPLIPGELSPSSAAVITIVMALLRCLLSWL